jgi:hypothetical protein
MTKPFTIVLPSFLRRVLQAYALKSHIRGLGCDLSRIGRSRNWQLLASPKQINDIIVLIENANQDSWLWLAKHLRTEHKQLSYTSLLDLAKYQPNISVNELMAKTDCTIEQARRVIDELEWSE